MVEKSPAGVKGAEELKIYWTKGKGALKIKWGAPGDFDRCVIELTKYFPQNAKGLCSNYHQAATGFRPGHAPSEGGNGKH